MGPENRKEKRREVVELFLSWLVFLFSELDVKADSLLCSFIAFIQLFLFWGFCCGGRG